MRFPLAGLLLVPLVWTVVGSNPTGRLAAFRNYGLMIPPSVITSRSERYDRRPDLSLNNQRGILGPRWNLPSQVTSHGSFKVIRFPKDEASKQESDKLTAGELLNILKPLKSEEGPTRELKWGFW